MKKIFFFITLTLAGSKGICNKICTLSFTAKDSVIQNLSAAQVIVTGFEARLKAGSVICNWITSKETNNNYFELERSFDGVNFKVTAIAFGAEGNSNETINYSYKDKNDALKRNDIVYYRLKQIGNDSTVRTIKTIKVILSPVSLQELGVVPNPFNTNFTYNLTVPTKGYVITKIVNLGGRLMATKHISVNKGYNHLTVEELNGFTSGLYIMEVVMNGSIIGRQKINKI